MAATFAFPPDLRVRTAAGRLCGFAGPAVFSATDHRADDRDHPGPLVHDVRIVQAENDVAALRSGEVASLVADDVFGLGVESPAVGLDDKTIADEDVHPPHPVDLDLHSETYVHGAKPEPHPGLGSRLGARIGQREVPAVDSGELADHPFDLMPAEQPMMQDRIE